MNEPVKSPGDYIRQELSQRGWSQRELAQIIDRPYQMVNELLQAKRGITAETAVALGAAFNTDPALWMQREAAYQATRANIDVEPVKRRVRLYELAPVQEMVRRNWIRPTSSIEELERELTRFFGVDSLEEEPTIGAATRRSGDRCNELSPSQRAWCFRVRQIAKACPAEQYQDSKLEECIRELRKMAAFPQEVQRVSDVLGKYGIRFVVVEPLKSCKVDGVVLWLSPDEPVIGMSLRYDRLDGFWFTLCHEIAHIRHRDESPVDCAVSDSILLPTSVKSEMEQRADAEAAAMLIDEKELKSFILRAGPIYSKDRIVQFANRIKIHPAIIVGQLQFRGEIGYHSHRAFLIKARQFVVPSSMTDGWGHEIDLGNLS